MNEREIRDRLVERGKNIFNRPKEPIAFTQNSAANDLLNDLDRHPHAFVLGCVMDRQIKAEKAWIIPHLISEKLGTFSIEELARLSRKKMKILMSRPKPLHRFSEIMSNSFHSAVQRISNQYSGDAARIWKENPSSAEVVYRFLQFDGVGPKIATMAANILAREFKIPFADHYSIDISADVHVCRVFSRLRLSSSDVPQVIYKARALYPAFPGIMDLAIWEIGRNWCDARAPQCGDCNMKDLCPTALQK